MNVFRKFLRKELGHKRYLLYVFLCQEEMEKQKNEEKLTLEGKEVYRDMIHFMRQMNVEEIENRKERLLWTVTKAFQIGRQFWYVFLFYVMACGFLLALELSGVPEKIALVAMTMCFAYKICEYLSNKFCFVDAYLIMLYQSAMDHVIKNQMR